MTSTLSQLTPASALNRIDVLGRENRQIWIPMAALSAVGVGEVLKSMAGCETVCDKKSKKKSKEKSSLAKRVGGGLYLALVAGLIYTTWRLRSAAKSEERLEEGIAR